MNKPARCNSRRLRLSRRAERGDALLEALTAMVLSSSLMLGIGYSSARTLKEQRLTHTQTLALAQLRGQLATQANLGSLCAAASPITIASIGSKATTVTIPVVVHCTFGSLTVSAPDVAGLSLPLPAQVLTEMALATSGASAVSMLGGDGKLEMVQ